MRAHARGRAVSLGEVKMRGFSCAPHGRLTPRAHLCDRVARDDERGLTSRAAVRRRVALLLGAGFAAGAAAVGAMTLLLKPADPPAVEPIQLQNPAGGDERREQLERRRRAERRERLERRRRAERRERRARREARRRAARRAARQRPPAAAPAPPPPEPAPAPAPAPQPGPAPAPSPAPQPAPAPSPAPQPAPAPSPAPPAGDDDDGGDDDGGGDD
jgi:hypothetical protein